MKRLLEKLFNIIHDVAYQYSGEFTVQDVVDAFVNPPDDMNEKEQEFTKAISYDEAIEIIKLMENVEDMGEDFFQIKED